MNAEQVFIDLNHKRRSPYFNCVMDHLRKLMEKHDGTISRVTIQIKHVRVDKGIDSSNRSAIIFISSRFKDLVDLGLMKKTGTGRYKVTENGTEILEAFVASTTCRSSRCIKR